MQCSKHDCTNNATIQVTFPNSTEGFCIHCWVEDVKITYDGYAPPYMAKILEDMSDEDIKSAVESIFALENDGDVARDKGDDHASWRCSQSAAGKQNLLEEIGITFVEDEQWDMEICHVHKAGKPWLIFDTTCWEWRSK